MTDQNVVYISVDRVAADLVARAAACAVSDLHESLPAEIRDAQLLSPAMLPRLAGVRVAGPAVTARTAPRDNLMMHRVLVLAEPGDMVVIEAGKPAAAQFGGLMGTYAKRKGLAGLVCDGFVRDIADVAALGFPMWSTGVSSLHPDKGTAGSVNVPVTVAGVRVVPGDLVVADDDGVVVVPKALAAATIAAAEARAARERTVLAGIAEGRSLYEMMNLAATIKDLGIREIDGAWPGE